MLLCVNHPLACPLGLRRAKSVTLISIESALVGDVWRNSGLAPKLLTFYYKPGVSLHRCNVPVLCVGMELFRGGSPAASNPEHRVTSHKLPHKCCSIRYTVHLYVEYLYILLANNSIYYNVICNTEKNFWSYPISMWVY